MVKTIKNIDGYNGGPKIKEIILFIGSPPTQIVSIRFELLQNQ